MLLFRSEVALSATSYLEVIRHLAGNLNHRLFVRSARPTEYVRVSSGQFHKAENHQ
jgi:hypothetical protein